VQANKDAASSVKYAGRKAATVGMALMPIEAPWPAAKIKEVLLQSCFEHGDRTGQF
jgi:hypothetical protein